MAVENARLPLSETGKMLQLYADDDASIKKEKELTQMEMSQPIIGLTKEQLEKYRNDPFWKPFRMFMFILFWFIWIAMFAGAVLIVILSPKCAAKNEPEWWRTKVSYQIFTPSFRDSDGDGVGDFKGIAEKLEEIRKIGIQNIWATPVITTDKDDFEPFDVTDFEQTDERFGTIEDFKYLIDEIHHRDMHFVMDLPLSTTSQKHTWFVRAAKGDKDYRDYYLWKNSEEVKGDPSYARLNGSNESYMVYEGKNPVLNWKNDKVKKAVTNAAKKYLDLGVDGFHIGYVSQLGRSQELASNTKEAYEALEYFKTTLKTYISSLNGLKEREIAVFTSLEDISKLNGGKIHNIEDLNVTSIEYVIDGSAKLLNKGTCLEGVPKCVYDMLNRSLEHFQRANLPHVWQFTDYRVSRLNTRFNATLGNLMTFLQLTLPGAIEVYYGQEIGMGDAENKTRKFTGLMQWDDSEQAGFTEQTNMELFFGLTSDYKTINFKVEEGSSRSCLKVFKTIAKLRQRDDTLLLGDVKLGNFQNGVIKFSRKRSEVENGPVYIIAANFAETESIAEVESLLSVSDSSNKAEVVVTTAEFDIYNNRDMINLNERLRMPPHQGILLKIY